MLYDADSNNSFQMFYPLIIIIIIFSFLSVLALHHSQFKDSFSTKSATNTNTNVQAV